MKKLTVLLMLTVSAFALTGCLTTKTTTVTPSTNSVTGTVTEVTNTVTTVNEANLAIDCAGLQLVGTPALIYALEKDPAARAIVVDVQIALTGALQGADTNVVAQIDGLIGGDEALQASVLPLIQGASALEQQLLVKYGSNNGVIISKAILTANLGVVNAALKAVPAK